MKPEEIKTYDEHLKKVADLKLPEPLPTFFTVAEDAKRAAETNYVLTTGDGRDRARTSRSPRGFPFQQAKDSIFETDGGRGWSIG